MPPSVVFFHALRARLASCLRRSASVVALLGLATTFGFTAEMKRNFDLPAGNAEAALKRFSAQSAQGVIFSTQAVAGIRTNTVRGELTPMQALNQLVGGTGLVAELDSQTGAFSVRRESVPNAGRAAPAQRSD